jgi:preprotein translocase subunit YajC
MSIVSMVGWVTLMVTLVVYLVLFTVGAIRTERKRKEDVKNIKIGDRVMVPTSECFYGIVSEVNEDNIKIEVVTPKDRVYVRNI